MNLRLIFGGSNVILNAIGEKLKHLSKGDFKGRQFEAGLILQVVSWYLRYPISYRDLESMFLERGFGVDHITINRWVLAYAPVIEKRAAPVPPSPPLRQGAKQRRRILTFPFESGSG
jgi:hypothetical protein